MKKGSIRRKIRTGTLFIFFLLLATAGTGIYYVIDLKQSSQDILKDNYESLDYCYSMQKNIIEIAKGNEEAIEEIEIHLKQQENNITEDKEGQFTNNLRKNFDALRATGDTSLLINMAQDLVSIAKLNMDAIKTKSEITNEKSKQAVTALSVIATLVFIVGIVFAVNFPSLLTGPISKLKEAVTELSNKNYLHRVHIGSRDEFDELGNTFNELAERLEVYEHSSLNTIMFEKSRAEAVINSLKDASIGIDSGGRVLFANRQSLALLDLTSEEIVGKDSSEIAAHNDLFRYITSRSGNTPFKIITDGKENYFVMDKYSIIVNDEEIGFVIALKNITSFQEKDTAKTNFISTISHELKTPLGSADLGLKLLLNPQTGGLNEIQRGIVEDLQKGNSRLLKLVSELLDMSQAETGHINLDITEFDIRDVLEEVENTVKPQAAQKSISMIKSFDPDSAIVIADREKAAWVLVNLISNAIRYSPAESSIQLRTFKTRDSLLTISVIDNGPGIPPQYRDKIFKRFFKVPGRESEVKGTGLGLSISKEFVEAMGGRISYRPAIEGGSEFRVEFRSAGSNV